MLQILKLNTAENAKDSVHQRQLSLGVCSSILLTSQRKDQTVSSARWVLISS